MTEDRYSIDDEPKYTLPDDVPKDVRQWVLWAKGRLQVVEEWSGRLQLENTHLAAKLKEQQELAKSYEAVLASRKSHTVYPPGSTVCVGPDNTPAMVVSVHLYHGQGVYYKVGYWVPKRGWQTLRLPESEVSSERPVPPMPNPYPHSTSAQPHSRADT